MTPALQARLRSVHLSRQPVLAGIELDLAPARWTAVVGPNGAGKSTLLRTLAGLLPCDGEVRLHGRPLAAWAPKARAREIAWLGQNEAGADDLSAHDVVMLGRLPHQAWLAGPDAADRRAVRSAMELTHCWPRRSRRLATLSGGERQRVLLARALAVEAGVLLLDEPLLHLDPPHQADWLALVRARAARGCAVVSVLHELNLALRAESLVVMQGGRVLHQGAPHQAATHDALQAVFDARLKFAQVDGQWLALPDV